MSSLEIAGFRFMLRQDMDPPIRSVILFRISVFILNRKYGCMAFAGDLDILSFMHFLGLDLHTDMKH